jgi:hypothetical protein
MKRNTNSTKPTDLDSVLLKSGAAPSVNLRSHKPKPTNEEKV